MSTKITEDSVRKLIRAMLEGHVEVPIKANPNVEPLMNDAQLDYIDRVPVDSVELSNIIGNKLRALPDDDAPHLYVKLAAVIDDLKDEEEEKEQMTTEDKLRSIVRKMLREDLAEADLPPVKKIPPGVHGGEYMRKMEKYKSDLSKMVRGGGADDPEEETGPKRGYMSTQAAGGSSFDEIAAEFGFAGPQGAKAAVEKALQKMKFLMQLPEEDRDFLVLKAMDDYINTLQKTGELSGEDVELLRSNPQVVQDLEGFRDHLHKFVLRGMRAANKETGTGEE